MGTGKGHSKVFHCLLVLFFSLQVISRHVTLYIFCVPEIFHKNQIIKKKYTFKKIFRISKVYPKESYLTSEKLNILFFTGA